MFTVEVGSAFTLAALRPRARHGPGDAPAGFILAVSLWLWFTVLFANFAEAMAEGRGKAQADTLRRRARQKSSPQSGSPRRRGTRRAETVPAPSLRKGEVVLVEAGDDRSPPTAR